MLWIVELDYVLAVADVRNVCTRRVNGGWSMVGMTSVGEHFVIVWQRRDRG